MVLEESGIRADACNSGQEALRKLEVQHARKQPYNMVLMDWNMPGMSGREASVEILKLYKKETTVVAMTAYNWNDIRAEAHSSGVESYLGKPLTPFGIIANLEQMGRL